MHAFSPPAPELGQSLRIPIPLLILVLVALVVTHTSCFSAPSSAWYPKTRVSTNCQLREELAGRTRLSVRAVNDVSGVDPPSMLIKMRSLSDPDSPLFYEHEERNPAEFDALPVGRWDVQVWIPTSRYAARCTVTLKENWICRVRLGFLVETH
jgi:hypothetical protein